MNERTFKPSAAHKLEDPERLIWLPPDEAVQKLNLAPGSRVADVGAGTGYFALPLAREIGTEGRLYAVDLQPEMLELLRAKLSLPGAPGNIELHQGAAAVTGLAARSCDLVFMANIWHELDDYAAVLAEAARILVPGGRIAILDWRNDVVRPPGPPLEHRISAAATAKMLGDGGWTVTSSDRIGAYNYLVVAER